MSAFTWPPAPERPWWPCTPSRKPRPKASAWSSCPPCDCSSRPAKAWHCEGRPGRYLGVCSSDKPADPYLVGVLTMVHTGDELAGQAADTHGPLNVFCTYDSLHKVVDAHHDFHLPRWDVVLANEAHRTAGDYDKPWARVHHDDKLPARHRLYRVCTVFGPAGQALGGLSWIPMTTHMDTVTGREPRIVLGPLQRTSRQ